MSVGSGHHKSQYSSSRACSEVTYKRAIRTGPAELANLGFQVLYSSICGNKVTWYARWLRSQPASQP